MENWKILLLLGTILFLACMPFLVIFPSGEVSASLGRGFLSIFDLRLNLLLVALVGLMAVLIGRDAMVLLPLSFILMFSVASMVQLNHKLYPHVYWFILGGLLIYTLTLLLVNTRAFVIGVTISTGAMVAEMEDPLYSLIGQIMALSLILATCICLSLTFSGASFESLKSYLQQTNNTVLVAVRSWFLSIF
jgi:hypothetical protein